MSLNTIKFCVSILFCLGLTVVVVICLACDVLGGCVIQGGGRAMVVGGKGC